MAIKEIAFSCYPVTSLKRARKFYEEILGLKPTSTWVDESGDKGMIEYDLGNATFAIGAGAEQFKPSREGASVAFEVDDFAATIKKLKDNNVNFVLEPIDTPVCNMAVVEDPDRSQILIHKRKEKPATVVA